ncbi:hypothetical protein GMJAKD_06305 [Candidatus Electrothrix aarhusensis]
MANKEQLKILRQGVAAWNTWREEHPDVKIDLRGATLDGRDLSGANFREADISGTSFRKAMLARADFSKSQAGAVENLVDSSIVETDFSSSDLTYAIFDNSDVNFSKFTNASTVGTSWKKVEIMTKACDVIIYHKNDPLHGKWILHQQSNLYENTILVDHNVRKLLVCGNGQGISLKGKSLKGAYLVEFNLRDTDLRESNFVQANLSGADITGAKLYGSARESWIIDGIRCDYVYWDEAGEQRTPSDREFRPGEFEELYKHLPTFEYIFEQGFTPLDPLIMDRVVRAINERHKEFKFDLINFDKRGQPHSTFTVCQIDFLDAAKEQVNVGYEKNRIALERQEPYMEVISRLLDQNDKSLDIIKQLGGDAMGDTYNIQGGQVGAVGKKAIATGNIFQQITPELSRLHQEMQNKAATPEQQAATEDIVKAEQAAQQGDESTMQQHLKNAGQWAVDCAQKVGTDVLTEYLKKLTLGT